MKPKLFIATKAFIVYNGKILILRETDSYTEGANVGRYDVPGGRLKAGEHFDKALRREVVEETGLHIEIGRPIAVEEWRPVVSGNKWQIVGIFFECHTSSSAVTLGNDHDAYEWIDPREYQKYDIIDGLKPVFEKYLRKHKG